MRFSIKRKKHLFFKRKLKSHCLEFLIVIAESTKEVEYIERLHKRIKKGLPIGKIDEKCLTLFCYTHTNKDVVEQDIDVPFKLVDKKDKPMFEPLLKDGGRSEKITSHGKNFYEHGALKIIPHSWFRLIFIHFRKWFKK